MAVRKKELDSMSEHFKQLKAQGLLVSKDKMDMLYGNEARAQSSYTPEYDCTYDGNQIIDVATGNTPPQEIVLAIEKRVKLLAPTMPSIADKFIKKLESSKLRE